MPASDVCQQLDELQVAREPGLLELGATGAPIVLGEVLRPLSGHLARQQAALHGSVDDHRYVLLPAIGQYLILDLPADHAVGWLEGVYRSYLLRPLHLIHIEVRYADVPYLSLGLQLCHR